MFKKAIFDFFGFLTSVLNEGRGGSLQKIVIFCLFLSAPASWSYKYDLESFVLKKTGADINNFFYADDYWIFYGILLFVGLLLIVSSMRYINNPNYKDNYLNWETPREATIKVALATNIFFLIPYFGLVAIIIAFVFFGLLVESTRSLQKLYA